MKLRSQRSAGRSLPTKRPPQVGRGEPGGATGAIAILAAAAAVISTAATAAPTAGSHPRG